MSEAAGGLNEREGKGFLIQPERRIPRGGIYDVAVVGGGIAGAAAAAAAARSGARVCLIEKEHGPGGLATLGNVAVYLPLCDGMGHQVSAGLAEELLIISQGDADLIPACWKEGGDETERFQSRYRITFNPSVFLLALESLLIGEGIDIWYDTRFCGVYMEDERITDCIVENKSGTLAVAAGVFVDASGDADVCRAAGENTVSLAGNVAAAWFYITEGNGADLHPRTRPFDGCGEETPGENNPGFRGDSGRDVSRMNTACRDLVRERLNEMKSEGRNGEPVHLPCIPSFRMTRRLAGEYELEESDDRVMFEDSVGLIAHWRKKGPVFSVPFRSLAGVKTENLITAGRCISAGKTGWDITRAIPGCAVTGEAAGTAAALSVQERVSIRDLDIEKLQKILEQNGVIIRADLSKEEGSRPDSEAGETH